MRFCKQNPKRAACASLVEREEKGFEVAPKRWKRKTIVSKVSRKWVPVWRAGICKWTPCVRSKFHTWEVWIPSYTTEFNRVSVGKECNLFSNQVMVSDGWAFSTSEYPIWLEEKFVCTPYNSYYVVDLLVGVTVSRSPGPAVNILIAETMSQP